MSLGGGARLMCQESSDLNFGETPRANKLVRHTGDVAHLMILHDGFATFIASHIGLAYFIISVVSEREASASVIRLTYWIQLV